MVQRTKSLTSHKRVTVFIVDDSTYDRSRSKAVELLARVHDYATGRFIKGFTRLPIGWYPWNGRSNRGGSEFTCCCRNGTDGVCSVIVPELASTYSFACQQSLHRHELGQPAEHSNWRVRV